MKLKFSNNLVINKRLSVIILNNKIVVKLCMLLKLSGPQAWIKMYYLFYHLLLYFYLLVVHSFEMEET